MEAEEAAVGTFDMGVSWLLLLKSSLPSAVKSSIASEGIDGLSQLAVQTTMVLLEVPSSQTPTAKPLPCG